MASPEHQGRARRHRDDLGHRFPIWIASWLRLRVLCCVDFRKISPASPRIDSARRAPRILRFRHGTRHGAAPDTRNRVTTRNWPLRHVRSAPEWTQPGGGDQRTVVVICVVGCGNAIRGKSLAGVLRWLPTCEGAIELSVGGQCDGRSGSRSRTPQGGFGEGVTTGDCGGAQTGRSASPELLRQLQELAAGAQPPDHQPSGASAHHRCPGTRRGRCPHRPLSPAAGTGRRRHGDGVPGRAAASGRAARGAQDHQGGHGLAAGAGPLRGRGTSAGHDGPSEHRQGVRCRRDPGRSALLRDGAGQGDPDHAVLRPGTSHARANDWSCSSPSARPCSTRTRRASSTAT